MHQARDAYIESVRRLYESGVPLREIADELRLSHQRVHQMVSETQSHRRKAIRKAAKGAIGMTLLVVVIVVAMQLARADGGASGHPGSGTAGGGPARQSGPLVAAPGLTTPQPVLAVRARMAQQ